MWIFESHVTEQVFEGFIAEQQIPVYRNEWLNRSNGVKKDGATLISITTLSGATHFGKMFLDVTYEGDLMAAAGVSYHVGREANAAYQETWNGVQPGARQHLDGFQVTINPLAAYCVPGDPDPFCGSARVGNSGSVKKRIKTPTSTMKAIVEITKP